MLKISDIYEECPPEIETDRHRHKRERERHERRRSRDLKRIERDLMRDAAAVAMRGGEPCI